MTQSATVWMTITKDIITYPPVGGKGQSLMRVRWLAAPVVWTERYHEPCAAMRQVFAAFCSSLVQICSCLWEIGLTGRERAGAGRGLALQASHGP